MTSMVVALQDFRLDTLRLRARTELGLRLRRTAVGYVCDRLGKGAIVARTPDELRRVLEAWLAGRVS